MGGSFADGIYPSAFSFGANGVWLIFIRMSKFPIKENSFDAAPGGTAGSLGYAAPYGTPGGGDVTRPGGI